MKKHLSCTQSILYDLYKNCKKRSRRINIAGESDESLVYFILNNSSTQQEYGERSFREVQKAVSLICRQLCPGEWCTREHCQKHSRRHAYNCTVTQPSRCKEYKKYIEKKNQKGNE